MLNRRRIEGSAFVLGAVLLASLVPGRPLVAQQLSERAALQIQAILADKAAWTPTEQKLATSLLIAHRQSRGRAMISGLPPFARVAARAGVDGRGMVVVDVRATVTKALLQVIADVGGELISAHPSSGALRARVPIARVDAIAARPEVRFVAQEEGFLLNTGSVTSQGDAGHAAAVTRIMYGIDGSGVRVGVLSDGVNSLGSRQATGDLPPTCASPIPASGACVAVVPGQAGNGNEGTAMLEIVHDLAPGAQLFFATAFAGSASFAANILTLRNTYGCDVIVDDVTYYAEGAFQDGVIAQAVNSVQASGALFFSSAGNSGRLSAGTSGTWEGDFVDSGVSIPTIEPYEGGPVQVHSFNGLTGGSAAYSDPLTATSGYISLKWSDPLGGSANDYDLFLLDSALTTVVDYSIVRQTGTEDPYEIMGQGFSGERIVVAKYSGATRALRVDSNRGRLSIATAGAVFGHNGGESTVSVAATDGRIPGAGNPFLGGAANPVENYSSDGPRRMFFNPNGSEITPGNVLFGTNGGKTLQKPDVTAADCVSTATAGFTTFCGTSAAAPHAGALAALLKSLPLGPSLAEVLDALSTSALDVNPPAAGPDRDSGAGIAMADLAANVLSPMNYYTLTPCRALDTRDAGGPTGGEPLVCGVGRTFTMVGGTCGVPASAKAVSLNVTAVGATAQGNVRLFAGGTPTPAVSMLNYSAGQTRANNAIVPLAGAGQMAVLCSPSGTSHVVVDVNGYFQ